MTGREIVTVSGRVTVRIKWEKLKEKVRERGCEIKFHSLPPVSLFFLPIFVKEKLNQFDGFREVKA